MRAGAYEHPREYIDSLFADYQGSDIFKGTLRFFGELFGPHEGAPEDAKLRTHKRIFLTGNLLGTELIDIAGGGVLVDYAATLQIDFPYVDDNLSEAEQKLQAAEQLQQRGFEIYHDASILHAYIDSWAAKIVKKNQREVLKAGVGATLRLGQAAIESFNEAATKDHAKFIELAETTASGNYDWDSDFVEVFGQ
jgi:hypothetical protein